MYGEPDLLSLVVPPGTVTAEARGSAPDAVLFEEEARAIGAAVDKRRREFATGRTLARRALAGLGYPPVSIPAGSNREPMWPDGIVGSITHCPGYCAAAVRRADDGVQALGIDAEPNESLPADVFELIVRPEEKTWIEGHPRNGISWDRLLFSAKESIFKAWFPAMRRWLDFQEAQVRFEPSTAAFQATLIGTTFDACGVKRNTLTGRFVCRHGLLVTSATVGDGLLTKRPGW